MSDSPPPEHHSSNPYSTPTGHSPAGPPPGQQGDATGGVIPYKNPKALIAYYTGIFSMLIFPLAFIAIPLGIMGLRDRKRNPAIKGSVHAWIGIVCGFLGLLCGTALVSLIVFAIMEGPRR